jgi:hypothetical protein
MRSGPVKEMKGIDRKGLSHEKLIFQRRKA